MFLVLVFTSVGSVLSLLIALLAFKNKGWQQLATGNMIAFSSGVLLTTAFFDLAPEASELLPATTVFNLIFTAIVSFFVLEKAVLWYHHHQCQDCARPVAWLITISDTFHNALDGILIAGATLVEPKLGLITALTVAAHEIPQEVADFSILISAGMRPKKAILLNILSACASLLSAGLAYLFLSQTKQLVPYTLAFSAGMFLYIALSDLIPELHHHAVTNKDKIVQLIFLGLGIGSLVLLTYLLPHV